MANKYSQSIRSEHVWWGYKADKYNNTLLLMRLYDINNIGYLLHIIHLVSLQCIKVHGVATENTNYWIKRNHNHMVSTNEMRLQ